jgi:HAD superfamily hydrolase (TIGR01484 family)
MRVWPYRMRDKSTTPSLRATPSEEGERNPKTENSPSVEGVPSGRGSAMKSLSDWPVEQRRNIIGVFTDIDDTLTTHGSITPDALQALFDLKAAGLHVIPITGRPIGWGESFAKDWPVDALVAENGGVAWVAKKNSENSNKISMQPAYLLPKVLSKIYQNNALIRSENSVKMAKISALVISQIAGVDVSQDSVGRETDLAFDYNEFVNLSSATVQQVVALLQQAGMETTVSSIHIHGCFGHFDKWTGAQWIVRELFQRDLAAELDQWVFVGDSGNDQAMFQHFRHSVGVANIRQFESQLTHLPRYITPSERGAGFAEVAELLLNTV